MTDTEQNTDVPNRIEVIYHADPLCGWCFAIADELEAARTELGSEVDWTLRMGGLVVGDRVRPVVHDADYLHKGLAQVAQVSDRIATTKYYDDIVGVGTWVSDSEPACRAVLTAIELDGTAAGFTASHFLSDRLYIDGQEPDDADSTEALALILGIDIVRFRQHRERTDTKQRLARHWADTRAMGLTTYPTIAVRIGSSVRELVTGYAPCATIVESIRRTVETEL